jgi:hypothetical protein
VMNRAAVAGSRHVTYVELKWGAKDTLWNCIWDVAKLSVLARIGDADEALILGGFSVDREWKHSKYGRLLETCEWDAADFQRVYRSDWRYWAKPGDARDSRRTGPHRLPSRFATTLIARESFTYDGVPWALGLVEVAPTGSDWIEVDDFAQPLDST